MNTLFFLLDTVFSVYLMVVLLRFWLQWTRAAAILQAGFAPLDEPLHKRRKQDDSHRLQQHFNSLHHAHLNSCRSRPARQL